LLIVLIGAFLGVPIPLFVHKTTGVLHPRSTALLEQVAQQVEQEGIDAWFELDPETLLGDEANDYEKVQDTLDVWFDSGVTHATVLENTEGLQVPADLYLEGSDQHRGWFNSSLMTAVAMREGVAPYKSVLTHGFTVDAKGHKMSKSRGNVVAPQAVIKNLGADILRLWVAATDYRGEMSVSDEILKRVADAYRRLRNTARFLLANMHGFDPTTDLVAPEQMLALDRWAVGRAYQLQQEVIQAYDTYLFIEIYQKVYYFCNIEMGSIYLDIIKDRQYTCKTDSIARRSAQTALYHIVQALTRWLAPILSFTADEIWQYLPGEKADSVFLTNWYTELWPLPADAPLSDAAWAQVFKLREQVSKVLEKLRNEDKIGASLDAEVAIYCDETLLEQLKVLGDELRFVLITSYAQVYPLAEKSAEAIEYEGVWIHAEPSKHTKCVRCWHRRADVGHYPAHPELCGRCVSNISDGAGEQRVYA